jgi:predicted amidohydrolase YtcJ
MGSLAIGKAADFVVLDKHILDVPKETIKEIRIEEVYHGGTQFTP